MSLMYKRYPPPPEGKTTVLIDMYDIYKDPAKPESQPLPKLESEKGIYLPTWSSLFTFSAVVGVLTTFQHLRLVGKW